MKGLKPTHYLSGHTDLIGSLAQFAVETERQNLWLKVYAQSEELSASDK